MESSFAAGAAVEKLAGITTVALDKTGTLTTGELRVEKVESFPPGREQEVACLAFSIEKLSTHPLARAITRHGKQQAFRAIELTEFESITGQGLRAREGTAECFVGKQEWLCRQLGTRRSSRLSASLQVCPKSGWRAANSGAAFFSGMTCVRSPDTFSKNSAKKVWKPLSSLATARLPPITCAPNCSWTMSAPN